MRRFLIFFPIPQAIARLLSQKIRIKQVNEFVLVEQNWLSDELCPVKMERPMLSFRAYTNRSEVERINVNVEDILESDYILDNLKLLPRVMQITKFLNKHNFVRCFVYDYAQLKRGQAVSFYVNTLKKSSDNRRIVEELLENLTYLYIEVI